MSEIKQLVYSIIQFLGNQLNSGVLSADATESLEVAIQCLENAYGIDRSSSDNLAVSRSLLSIFAIGTQDEQAFDLCDDGQKPVIRVVCGLLFLKNRCCEDVRRPSRWPTPPQPPPPPVKIEKEEHREEEAAAEDQGSSYEEEIEDRVNGMAVDEVITTNGPVIRRQRFDDQEDTDDEEEEDNDSEGSKPDRSDVISNTNCCSNGKAKVSPEEPWTEDGRPLDLSLSVKGEETFADNVLCVAPNPASVTSTPDSSPHYGDHHHLERMPPKGGCVQCGKEGRVTKRGRPHESYFGCRNCKVHLCRKRDCFRIFHAFHFGHTTLEYGVTLADSCLRNVVP